jgi:hypothetical protein
MSRLFDLNGPTLVVVPTVRQVCAACAAVMGSASTGGLLIAAAHTPGLQVRGYLSELGAVGAPWAGTYRAAILGIAVAVGLLAIAIEPVSLLAAGALGAAAALAAVSGTVRCTPGCPLPPTAAATPADIIHASASIAALTLVACAMLLLARTGADPLARACRYALVLVIALGTPVGAGIVLVGTGVFTGVLERAMMAVAIAWQVGVSAMAVHLQPPQLAEDPASPTTERHHSPPQPDPGTIDV